MWDRATNRRAMWCGILAILLGFLIGAKEAHAQLQVGSIVPGRYAFQHFLLSCGNPCVIRYNGGGIVDDFTEAVEWAKWRGQFVQIDGPCGSACASFADLMRPNVCITRRAEFRFHRARLLPLIVDGKVASLIIPKKGDPAGETPQSSDVLAWVHAHGGFPVKGWTTMNARAASQFWPRCHDA